MDEIAVDLIPEGDGGDFHLLNSPGGEFRNVLARTTNVSSPLKMRIRVVEVHHGEMEFKGNNCLATLLVLEFRFQSQKQEHRYKMAEVALDFFDKLGHARLDPTVVQQAPDRMWWMNKTTYNRTTKFGTSFGATGGVELASGNLNMHWDMEQTKPLKFKATLTGSSGSSAGRYTEKENSVTWTMQENPDEADGIPSFLQTAVLLKREHNEPFYAKLRVKTEVDLASAARRILRFMGDQDRIIQPITITPDQVQVKNFSVTGIKEGDLKQMHKLPVNQYFRVNFEEGDSLVHAAPIVVMVGEGQVTTPPAPAVSVTIDQPLMLEMASAPAPPLPAVSASAVALRVVASAARAAAKASRAAAEAADAAAQAAEAAAQAADIAAEQLL